MKRDVLRTALILASSALLLSAAGAQPSTKMRGAILEPRADSAAVRRTSPLGSISASRTYQNASLGTGAVGLRNLGGGVIEVSGVVPPVRAAFLYWAVISQGSPPAASRAVLIRRTGRTFTDVAGTVIGTGPSPCWGGDRITVFRGSVPTSVAAGNGVYRIKLKPGATGGRDGVDPWAEPEERLPLFDGATLVLVGSGAFTVAMYDKVLPGKTFSGGQLSYILRLPKAASSSAKVLLHSTGADGQTGAGYDDEAAISGEVTTIGTQQVRIAGPGSPENDSDWNGGIAQPLPQLWDNTIHDITDEAKAASIGTDLPISITSNGDCLTPVANNIVIQ